MTGNADQQLKRAQTALNEGRFNEAGPACVEILKQNPNNAAAITILGEIAWRKDLFPRAFELFRKAHLTDPDLLDPIIGLAKTFALMNHLASAREAAERAVGLRPRKAEHLFELGRVFTVLADDKRALGFFEQAVTAAPKNLDYIMALAVARQMNGDVEGAERTLRRCLELNPDVVAAYYLLVGMKPQTKDDNFVSVLERLFAREDNDLQPNLTLGHALAKSHEDLGDPVAAMAILDRAKSRRREAVPYNRARTEEIFEQATATFPPSTPVGKPNPSDAPIFVFGMPRSGTTLTDRILSSHPEVTSVGETLCVINAVRRTIPNLTMPRLDDPEIFRLSASIDMGRVAEAYLNETSVLLKEPNRHFVDKLPHNFLFAGLIHRALPNARIICLRRDPIDVCLSNYRMLFDANSVFHEHVYSLGDLGHYYLLFDKLMAHWGAVLPPDRFMSLQYESLVANQETETRRLLEFCDLPWDERCLAFHENKASVATPSVHQVRQPMFTSSIGRWRRYGDSLKPLIEVLEQGGVLERGAEGS